MSGHIFDNGRPSGKWACLTCRRVWKRIWKPEAHLQCAVCQSPLHFVGKYFAAPPANNAAQWRKVGLLLESGLTFGSQHRGEPRPPAYLSEIPDFLREQREARACALHQSQQSRAGERARQKKQGRKRARRVAQKKRMDDFIERQARIAST